MRGGALTIAGLLVCVGILSRVCARPAATPIHPLIVRAQVAELLSQMRRSATDSDAVYVVGDSVRFQAEDRERRQHYWGWAYSPREEMLVQCMAYTARDGVCDKAVQGVSLPYVNGLHLVTNNSGQTIVAMELRDAFSRPSLRLEPRSAGYNARDILVPVALLGKQVRVSTPTVVFASTRSSPRIVSASLENYDEFLNYAARPWAVSSTCGGTADVRLVRPIPPSGTASVVVKPRHPGKCMVSVIADPHDGSPLAVPATVKVVVLGPLSWSPNHGKTVPELMFPSTIASSVTSSIHRQYASAPLRLSFDNSCRGVVKVRRAAAGAVDEFNAPAVIPITAGYCLAAIGDQFEAAENAPPSLHVAMHVMGNLSLSPNRRVTNLSLRFSSVKSGPTSFLLYKTFDPTPLRIVFASNGCSGIAGFYPEDGGTPNSVSPQPTWRKVFVVPARSGTCMAELQDQYGTNDLIIRVRLTVGGRSSSKISGIQGRLNRARHNNPVERSPKHVSASSMPFKEK